MLQISVWFLISLAPNNPETVKNLKNVFEGLKAAAKFYSQVHKLSACIYVCM